MIALVFLALYSIFISVILTLYRKKLSSSDPYAQLVEEVPNNVDPVERAKILVEIAKMRDARIPWYEKSLSTIGVVAFFSMLLATGLQTVKSNAEQIQVAQLKSEVGALEKERTDVETFLSTLSQSVESEAILRQEMNRPTREILLHRLKQLQGLAKPSKEEILELFNVAVLLRDYSTAKEVVSQNIGLLDQSKPEFIISIAEYQYMVGARNSANDSLGKIRSQISTLPPTIASRIVVLDASLDGQIDAHTAEFAQILRISPAEARQQLADRVAKLRTGAS
jgi:cell division protein FtsB